MSFNFPFLLLPFFYLFLIRERHDLKMEARFNTGFNAHTVSGLHRQQQQQHPQQQFPVSTFPETFKDFFSMTNEDEDQIELISNLEDKVSVKAIT